MKAPVLFVIGTPGGHWADWAQAVLAPTPFARRLGLPQAHAGSTATPVADIEGWLPPEGDTPWGGVAPTGWQRVDALSTALEHARFVAFIEPPQAALAAALAQDSPPDPQAALDEWSLSARVLLRMVQALRRRCVLLDAEEARRAPATAWAAAWARLQMQPLTLASATTAVAASPIGDAVAGLIVRDRPEVLALHAELLTACELLPGVPPAPAHDVPALLEALHEQRAAIPQLAETRRTLQAAERKLGDRKAELQRLQSELDAERAAAAHAAQQLQARQAAESELQARLAELKEIAERESGLRAAAEAALDGAREALAAAQAELALQCGQLQQQETALLSLTGEHEALLAEQAARVASLQSNQDAIERRLHAAQTTLEQTAAELHRARATRAEAEGALQVAQAARAKAEAERDAAHAALQREAEQHQQALALAERDAAARDAATRREVEGALKAEQQALRQRADAARHEAATLLVQLHEAQEALEVVDARRRKLEATPAAPPKPAPPPVVPAAAARAPAGDFTIGEAHIVDAQNAPPFLGTTFALRRIKVAERDVPEATVRLVEHHGNPGLVVFGPAKGRGPLLQSWHEDGAEDERPFMLLVPSDQASASTLDNLGSDDWQMLLAVAARLEAELRAATGAKRERWIWLARRLQAQLLERPARWRYAGLELKQRDGGWQARFTRVHWGVRELRGLTVLWKPEARALALLHMDGRAPLMSWPAGEDGQAPAELWLPVGSARQAPATRAVWDRVPPADRTFAAALLQAWPAVVASGRAEGFDAAALAAPAAALQGESLALATPDGAHRFQGLLRRLARRLGARGMNQ